MKGKLFVISGPSGAGKSSLIKELLKNNKDKLKFSVSYTSRKPREGEVDGVDYFFVSEETFKDNIKKGLFLEWACVHENYYGTLKSFIEDYIKEGKKCILDIDVQGALTLMSKNVEAEYIFVSPPSISVLKQRLLSRGTDVAETIDLRVKNAESEMKFKSRYQVVVVNDDFDTAYNELKNIILK